MVFVFEIIYSLFARLRLPTPHQCSGLVLPNLFHPQLEAGGVAVAVSSVVHQSARSHCLFHFTETEQYQNRVSPNQGLFPQLKK
jgi:CelD/BcsL family acetyltransferase involved in cellulose biosynthesis